MEARNDAETMEEDLDSRLREAGENLRARHDDAIIADVIGEVEGLDTPNSDETADLLRKMVDFDE